MMTRAQRVRTGYTVATVYVAATALLLFLETTRFRSRLSDHGAFFMPVSLFLLVPVWAVVLWGLNRRCRAEHSGAQKAYLAASRVVFAIAWLFSCLPAIFWIGIVQPWPLTLRHGPDTNYARQGFASLVGVPPPASVSGIYYRADTGWLDSQYRLRFTCSDGAVVTQMVTRLQLQEIDTPRRWIDSRSATWWAEGAKRKGLRYYARENTGSYYWYLWYDPATGTVWYEEFSV